MPTGLDGRRLLVVGGGVVGLASARLAARAGAAVVLYEAGEIGRSSASAAASGLITLTLPGKSPFRRFKRAGYWAAERWLETLPILPQSSCRRFGAMILDPQDPSGKKSLLQEWREAGHQPQWSSPGEVASLTPGLDGDSFQEALTLDQEIVIDPVELLTALREDFIAAGGELQERRGKIEVRPVGESEIELCTAEGSPISSDADFVLLAAGWESAKSLDKFPEAPLALTPVGGIGLDLRFEPPPATIHFGAESEMHWVPRGPGRVYLGSTVRGEGATAGYSSSEVETLLTAAREHWPTLDAQAVLSVRDGLRPKALRFGGPFLGQYPGRRRLWVATGHYRIGLATAAATAELLVEAWGGTVEGRQHSEEQNLLPGTFSVARGLAIPTD